MALENDVDNAEVLQEGYLELMTGSGVLRSFHRRYMVIMRNGMVELFEKSEKRKKPKEFFQLQGGEEIMIAVNYQKRFRFKIVIPDHKKPIKWCFGFESEQARDSWLSVFQGVMKHLNALMKLHEVFTTENAETMEGQLKIGQALAVCGQLSKARRIFTKLISKYGQESSEVHEHYEKFLSSHCNDIHQAEEHFLRRKKFFCLPKEFILNDNLGEEFKKVSKRIDYMTEMKNQLIMNQTNTNDKDDEESKSYQIEYRNLENIWPFYLYSVETKHLKFARKIVKQWLKGSDNYDINTYHFEFTYKDIEQQSWYIIKQCIDGKKGVVRLQARLEAVADSETQKKLASEKYAIQFDTPSLVPQDDAKEDSMKRQSTKDVVFPSKEEYLASMKNSNAVKENMLSAQANIFPPHAKSESILADDVMADILDDLDDLEIDIDDDQSKTNDENDENKEQEQQPKNVAFKFDDDEDELYDDEDNTKAIKYHVYGPDMGNLDTLHRLKMEEEIIDDVDDILDSGNNLNAQIGRTQSGVRATTVSGWDDIFNTFTSIHTFTNNKAHQIFPWSAFMLVWQTRRDDMLHIGDGNKNTHVEPLQCILEFVYLFTRGCMQQLEHYWEYALLLCTLYNMSSERDHEDVKYKMCLSGVRVIGDKNVTFDNKSAVSKFMKTHHWLSIVKGQNKILSMRKYYLKGLRDEIQRLHNALNAFYDVYLYGDNKNYHTLHTISTKKCVRNEITSQTADKVQGKCTWGPRSHDKYDKEAFKLVCQHRQISPVPKPQKKSGNFDEAYMMFCLCLAAKINPYFQKQVLSATKHLNCKHSAAPIKTSKRCYELIRHELAQLAPPKAARILDYCKCTLTFDTIINLLRGYKSLDDKFRICKIINYFDKKSHNINNYKYMNVYIICKHPTIKFIKLICEVRLTLNRIQDLHDERAAVKECYGEVLHPSEIKAIMKEVITGKVPKDKVHSPRSIV